MTSLVDPTSDDPYTVALDAEGLRRRSFVGSIVTGIAQIAKIAIQFGSQLVLARLLMPGDFGLIAMVAPLVGFIQIFNDLGFAQAVVQSPTLNAARLSALFWVNLAVSVALLVAIGLLAPFGAWLFEEPMVFPVTMALAVMMPVAALGVIPSALLTRRMMFKAMAVNEVSASIAGIVTTVVFAYLGWSYWALVFGQGMNTLVSTAMTWYRSGWRPMAPAFVRDVWDDLKFGGGLTGANLATFATTAGDNVLIGMTVGRVALGYYDRSYRLTVQPLSQLIAPISRVAVPLLSRLKDNPIEYRAVYLDIYRALLLLCVPPMLVCISNADAVIHVLLGERWQATAPIFAWICVGGLTSGIYSSATWLFISQGRTLAMMRFMIWAAVLNVISYLVGALGGVVGIAACAALVFVLVTTPLVLFGATRCGPVGWRDLAHASIPFVFQGTVILVMLQWQKGHALPGIAQVIAASALCLLVLGLTCLAIPTQRHLLGRLVQAVRRR